MTAQKAALRQRKAEIAEPPIHTNIDHDKAQGDRNAYQT
jgi:hypothetical protein